MKFRLKNALMAALLSLGAITQSGCDCTTVNVLCDLVNTFLGTPSNTITVGQAFEVNCDITNLPGAGKCDVTGIANAIQVFFKDGSKTANVVVEYPVGHRRRRKEGVPLLEAKFRTNLARKFPEKQRAAIYALCQDQQKLEATPVHEFVDMMVI